MPRVDRAYRASTRALGALTFLVGLAMVGVTIGNGGGPLAVGVVVGVLLTVLGALRFILASRERT